MPLHADELSLSEFEQGVTNLAMRSMLSTDGDLAPSVEALYGVVVDRLSACTTQRQIDDVREAVDFAIRFDSIPVGRLFREKFWRSVTKDLVRASSGVSGQNVPDFQADQGLMVPVILENNAPMLVSLGSMGSMFGKLESGDDDTAMPSVTLNMFPDAKEGDVVLQGTVGFAMGGAFGPWDTEYLLTDDGRTYSDNYLFRGYTGQVSVIRTADGFRVERRKNI